MPGCATCLLPWPRPAHSCTATAAHAATRSVCERAMVPASAPMCLPPLTLTLTLPLRARVCGRYMRKRPRAATQGGRGAHATSAQPAATARGAAAAAAHALTANLRLGKAAAFLAALAVTAPACSAVGSVEKGGRGRSADLACHAMPACPQRDTGQADHALPDELAAAAQLVGW